MSVTAISDTDFWTLGIAPCGSPPCTSIVRTTDGGARFMGIPAPRAALAAGTNQLTGSTVRNLRFADPLDGWAFGGGLYATHDGGATWDAVPVTGLVLDVEAAGGTAWAVVASSCGQSGCQGFRIERSAVTGNHWATVPVPTGDQQPALGLYGGRVWILVNDSGGRAALYAGTNAGSSFSRFPTPCQAHLGGLIAAAGSTTLWAQCPTGTLSSTLRSRDGGARFGPVHNPEVPNSTLLAASEPDVAYLAPEGDAVLRTTNGGASFQPVLTVSGALWSFVGFTDPATGYAIAMTGSDAQHSTLWRTADGGTTWTAVQF